MILTNIHNYLYLIAPLVLLSLLIFLYVKYMSNKKNTIVEATILTKRQESKVSYCGISMRSEIKFNSYVDYYIQFLLQDNSTIELRVLADIYKQIEINDIGDLNYHGAQFISFDKKPKR